MASIYRSRAVPGDHRVQRHVLRLERGHLGPGRRAADPAVTALLPALRRRPSRRPATRSCSAGSGGGDTRQTAGAARQRAGPLSRRPAGWRDPEDGGSSAGQGGGRGCHAASAPLERWYRRGRPGARRARPRSGRVQAGMRGPIADGEQGGAAPFRPRGQGPAAFRVSGRVRFAVIRAGGGRTFRSACHDDRPSLEACYRPSSRAGRPSGHHAHGSGATASPGCSPPTRRPTGQFGRGQPGGVSRTAREPVPRVDRVWPPARGSPASGTAGWRREAPPRSRRGGNRPRGRRPPEQRARKLAREATAKPAHATVNNAAGRGSPPGRHLARRGSVRRRRRGQRGRRAGRRGRTRAAARASADRRRVSRRAPVRARRAVKGEGEAGGAPGGAGADIMAGLPRGNHAPGAKDRRPECPGSRIEAPLSLPTASRSWLT
jgi:hypothetical protein